MNAIREHKFITVCIIVAILVIALVLCMSLQTTEEDIQKQADSIRDTVKERALQCYVIEGAYPESLSYLEDNYGLTVNKEDFKVVYAPYAENMAPDVRVVYKGVE